MRSREAFPKENRARSDAPGWPDGPGGVQPGWERAWPWQDSALVGHESKTMLNG